MTAQSREFPIRPVMMSMDATVVMATSAALDMIGGCQCKSPDLEKTNQRNHFT